jgi:hypothetical protein
VFRPAAEHFLRAGCLALVAAAGLAGCGGSGAPGGSDAASGATGSSAATGKQRRGDGAGMVAAVSAVGKPGAPVEMKFDILERPEPGKTVPIVIEVTPIGADIATLDVSVQATDGIEVLDGAQMPQLQKPADGATARHTVNVRPQRDGVFYVSIVALVEQPSGSIARSFSIPIIVGGGAAASAAVSGKAAAGGGAALKSDASGNSVVSMPAQESP